MPISSNAMEEMNLLMQFDSSSASTGIKVHSDARPELRDACQRLFDKDLVDQHDGGYLTDAGIEARGHLQALTGLLSLKSSSS